jgi:hypothetical protein
MKAVLQRCVAGKMRSVINPVRRGTRPAVADHDNFVIQDFRSCRDPEADRKIRYTDGFRPANANAGGRPVLLAMKKRGGGWCLCRPGSLP